MHCPGVQVAETFDADLFPNHIIRLQKGVSCKTTVTLSFPWRTIRDVQKIPKEIAPIATCNMSLDVDVSNLQTPCKTMPTASMWKYVEILQNNFGCFNLNAHYTTYLQLITQLHTCMNLVDNNVQSIVANICAKRVGNRHKQKRTLRGEHATIHVRGRYTGSRTHAARFPKQQENNKPAHSPPQ